MTVRVVPFRRVEGRIEEMSDEALVGACAFADQAALVALFDRHHLRLHRFLCRAGGVSSSDAEDLLQDTFAAVWTSADRFQGEGPALSWMFGIAANVARNHIRGRNRRAHALQALSELPESNVDRTDDIAARRELIRKFEVALTELPHDQRVVVVMCDLEGIQGTEVARALGLRPGTVWRRLHEARKKIRRALGEAE